jgi:hypothetical protein
LDACKCGRCVQAFLIEYKMPAGLSRTQVVLKSALPSVFNRSVQLSVIQQPQRCGLILRPLKFAAADFAP